MSREEPVEPQYVEEMKNVMRFLDHELNPGGEKKIGIAVLMFPFGEDPKGRMNYMSNARRKDMIAALKELIANFEGRTAYPEGEQ